MRLTDPVTFEIDNGFDLENASRERIAAHGSDHNPRAVSNLDPAALQCDSRHAGSSCLNAPPDRVPACALARTAARERLVPAGEF